ncbi:MAG: tRNA (adenosine(37)-N6)-dimethylallyltransferase MiaA [Leptospiraceae bacterium]|nr:tRNA (adenosine(37)-N6)-dimethylallyltransferase MiaA [Leptospiraceae bacterium]
MVSELNPEIFEVISFDSRQIYQELDIGTAKPTLKERECIEHHLVDFLSPSEKINANIFVELANDSLNKILLKNKIPVIVCGTGFYLKAFLYGMYPVPSISEKIKNQIESMAKSEKWDLLKELDFEASKNLSQNDEYRIIRALEVNLSGVRWSELKNTREEGVLNRDDLQITGFFLDEDRQTLYNRINKRAEEMIQNGILDETRKVLKKYGENCPAFNTLGYNFTLEFIRGKLDIDSLRENLKKSHRNYAKKQITWFRKEKILKPVSKESVLDYLKKYKTGKICQPETIFKTIY